MKNITLIILILFTSVSFAKVLDQAIVIIENDVITQAEYQSRLKFVIDQYRLAGNPLPNDLEALTTDFRSNGKYKTSDALCAKKWSRS